MLYVLLKSTYIHQVLVSLEYIGEIFTCEFCWLTWRSPKTLFWASNHDLWESASLSHHSWRVVAASGVHWLVALVLHSIFGHDHEFSVVVRSIVIMYFQPSLWFHALQQQKGFVFVTYLHKHFASYFFFSELVFTWLRCRGGGRGVGVEQIPESEGAAVSWAGSLLALVSTWQAWCVDQVELAEKGQQHRIPTTVHGITKNRRAEHDVLVLLDWMRVFEYW